MLKHPVFVVAVDLAREMTAPVAVAFALAKQYEGSVHLVEVVSSRQRSRLDDSAHLGPPDSLPSNRDWSQLEDAIAKARRHVHVRARTFSGEASKVLPSYVQLTQATLLILGKQHGTSWWRRNPAIVSSLSRSAAVPALVVPPEFDVSKRTSLSFRHVVSPVDLSVSSAVALRVVVQLLRRSGARLTLVHALENAPRRTVYFGAQALRVAEDLERQAAHVAQRLRRKVPADVRIHADARVTTGDPSRGILDIASDVEADLIVMGVPPRSRRDEVLFGSTLRKVLRSAKVPVLVLPVAAGANKWLEDSPSRA
jgi:nucleotide-binding universal stress UspA family protein